MAAFATAPAAWVHSSNTPDDNISAAPSGNNRKLVVIIGAEDADAWSITTMQVGGVSATTTFAAVDTNESTQESRIRAFEWNEAAIASMSGTAITYADGSFINPMAITHYWLEDADQDPSTQYSATIITTDSLDTVTVTAGAAPASGDMVVGCVVSSDDTWDVTDWGPLTGTVVEDETNGNYYVGLCSDDAITDTSYAFDMSPATNVRAAAIVLVHPQAASSLPATPSGKQDVTVAQIELSAATQADPVRVTATGHGIADGQQSRIHGITSGMTELNTAEDKAAAPDDGLLYFEPSLVDANNLDLDDIDGTGFGSGVTGGVITPGFTILEGASPAVVDGDTIRCDDETSPGGYAITMNPDGTFSYDSSGDDSRQSFVVDVWDASESTFHGEVTIYVNNRRPNPIGSGVPSLALDAGVEYQLDLALYFEDFEGDPMTYTLASGTESWITLSGSIVTLNPPSEGAGSFNVEVSDGIDTSTFTVEYSTFEGVVVTLRAIDWPAFTTAANNTENL